MKSITETKRILELWKGAQLIVVFLFTHIVAAQQPQAEDWEKIASESDEPAVGHRIARIVENSKASELGLKPGDWVLRKNGMLNNKPRVAPPNGGVLLQVVRKGGRKEVLEAERSPVGYQYVQEFRPWLSFLREEVGVRNPKWDALVVEATTQIDRNPKKAEELLKKVVGAGYPVDDLFYKFCRLWLDWRLGRSINLDDFGNEIRIVHDKLPDIYVAQLEIMGMATADTELLASLAETDEALLRSPSNSILKLEEFAYNSSGEFKGVEVLQEAEKCDRKEISDNVDFTKTTHPDLNMSKFRSLKSGGTFAARGGSFQSVRFALPDPTLDFHLAMEFIPESAHNDTRYLQEIRVGCYFGYKKSDDPVSSQLSSSLAMKIGLTANRFLEQAQVSFEGGFVPGRIEVPSTFKIGSKPGSIGKLPDGTPMVILEKGNGDNNNSGVAKIDVVRIGNDIAGFCNGVCYAHYTIFPENDSSMIELFVSGMSTKVTDLKVWKLDRQ